MPEVLRLVAGGLRGLSVEQTLHFARPSGAPGSGLTILVGSNNSGKSTVIEALRLLSQSASSSVSEGRRNKSHGDAVTLWLEMEDGTTRTLATVHPGGSETAWTPPSSQAPNIFVVPSRRAFAAYFGARQEWLEDRHQYSSGVEIPALKSATVDHFAHRLFRINRNPAAKRAFDDLLGEVVSPLPDWVIDQTDAGAYYLKFLWKGEGGTKHAHSSDGVGEGLISLLFIIDSLYDAAPGSMVVIDEPELSLHPQFQRRLQAVMSKRAAHCQIVYATHSPYFVSWPDLGRGAVISRVYKTKHGTTIATPSQRTLLALPGVVAGRADRNNPHVLGLDATEVFFLEDGVVLAEGQEDVVFLRPVLEDLGVTLNASFFGWGVGGAPNMRAFSRLFQELGYRRVVGILDNDMGPVAAQLTAEFPEYHFECTPADDVRPKPARAAAQAKEGLVDSGGKVRAEHRVATVQLLERAAAYLRAAEPG